MTAELVGVTPAPTGPGEFLGRLTAVVDAVKAGAAQRDSTRTYARAEIDALRRIGFWSLTVPAEFGGLGLGPDTLIQAILALAAADASLGQIPQNHFMSVERIRLTTSRHASVGSGWRSSAEVRCSATPPPKAVNPTPGTTAPGWTATATAGGCAAARCTPPVRSWPNTSRSLPATTPTPRAPCSSAPPRPGSCCTTTGGVWGSAPRRRVRPNSTTSPSTPSPYCRQSRIRLRCIGFRRSVSSFTPPSTRVSRSARSTRR